MINVEFKTNSNPILRKFVAKLESNGIVCWVRSTRLNQIVSLDSARDVETATKLATDCGMIINHIR